MVTIKLKHSSPEIICNHTIIKEALVIVIHLSLFHLVWVIPVRLKIINKSTIDHMMIINYLQLIKVFLFTLSSILFITIFFPKRRYVYGK
jgi:hypothetical protein